MILILFGKEGDNYTRTVNLFDEVPESISLIRKAIETIPKGEVCTPVELKSGYTQWKNEAPHGEVTYTIETNGNLIKYISIRNPSIPNMDSCAKYMIRDVPSIFDVISNYASSDPCVSCLERTNDDETYLTDICRV